MVSAKAPNGALSQERRCVSTYSLGKHLLVGRASLWAFSFGDTVAERFLWALWCQSMANDTALHFAPLNTTLPLW